MASFQMQDRIIDPLRYPWGFVPSSLTGNPWVAFLPEGETEYPFPFHNTTVRILYDNETYPKGILSFERQNQSSQVQYLTHVIDIEYKINLKIVARCTTLGQVTSRMNARVMINGQSELFLNGVNTTFDVYTLDLLNHTNPITLSLGYSSTNYGGADPYLVEYADYWIE